MKPYIVAVTGGIASGKSLVCARFTEHGIGVVDADLVAREVVAPGEPALAEIRARFGPDICTADGQLDRPRLRAAAFEDAQARRWLEALLHPRIRERMLARCEAAESAYVVVAIPLLAEGGGRARWPWLDRILVIDAPETLRVQRLIRRDGVDEDLALRMLSAQARREDRLAIADDVISNSGDLASLNASVDALHTKYLALAAER